MWYGGECTYHNMEEIKNTAQENDFNLIISVGGGKAKKGFRPRYSKQVDLEFLKRLQI